MSMLPIFSLPLTLNSLFATRLPSIFKMSLPTEYTGKICLVFVTVNRTASNLTTHLKI